MIQKVKGTQDFLDLRLFNFCIDTIKQYLALYHFTEIATPIVEPLELFQRSLGEQTDVITKEMFLIDTRDTKEKICLRPEATASTVRAFIEHGNLQVPWKVFSYGSMFRYERPQKGRYREFHQASIEVIGSASILEDVQLIKMLDRLFKTLFCLDNYALSLNFLGCLQDREQFKKVLKLFLDKNQNLLCATCLVRKEKNILRVFDCKIESCKKLYQDAPLLIEHLCAACTLDWQQVQHELAVLSVRYQIVPTLVRGLDYYDKTVFEFVSSDLGAQNAFCSGGRYDGLAKELGGAHQPSVGAALGIERLLLLLEPVCAKLPIPQKAPLHIIVPLSQEQRSCALQIADMLQAAGFCVDVLFQDSLKSMIRKADKFNAAYCILIGSEEQQRGVVTLKDMVKGEEKQIVYDELIAYLKQ